MLSINRLISKTLWYGRPMNRREQREMALLRLELRTLTRSALVQGSPELSDAVARVVERAEGLPSADGLSVAQTAERLGVSEPTVRAWLGRGVLVPVAGASPVEVTLDSYEQAQRALDELVERGRDRDWLTALSDHLRAADVPEEMRGITDLDPDEYEIV
jgi:hypothetical protein